MVATDRSTVVTRRRVIAGGLGVLSAIAVRSGTTVEEPALRFEETTLDRTVDRPLDRDKDVLPPYDGGRDAARGTDGEPAPTGPTETAGRESPDRPAPPTRTGDT